MDFDFTDDQVSLRDAVARRIDFTSPEGKAYRLREQTARLTRGDIDDPSVDQRRHHRW